MPLIYEPLNRYESNLLNRAEDAVAFLETLETDNIVFLADLFHMNIEEANIADGLRIYGRHIGHVHFVDSNRRPAGCGHMDYAPIAAALKEVGYDKYASAEAFPWPDSDAAAKATIDAFNQPRLTMERRKLGKTDLELPVISTASSLGQEFRRVTIEEALQSCRVALELGMNFIDTSPFYGRGMSEVLLGQVLRDLPREEFILGTKLGRYDLDHFDFSARRVAESIDVTCTAWAWIIWTLSCATTSSLLRCNRSLMKPFRRSKKSVMPARCGTSGSPDIQ